MSFSDLPPDWPSRSLTDPALVADVLDLVVTERSRAAGAIYLLLCDDQDRLLVPVAIDDLDPGASLAERTTALSGLLAAGAEFGTGSVLAAIARTGGLSTTTEDTVWAEAIAAAVAEHWRLLGVHVVTPDGSRPVPRQASAA